MSAVSAIPHTREFLADTLTPLGVYQRLSRLSPWRFLFESVTGGEQVSRYSFLGAAPRAVYRLYADRLEEEDAVGRRALPGSPLDALARLTSSVVAEPGSLPFTGGFVGYFGYDLARLVERLPERPPDPHGLPLAQLGRFDRLVVFDHAHQRLFAVANEIEGQVSREQADRDLDDLAELLEGAGESGAVALGGPQRGTAVAEPLFDGDDYQRAVHQAKGRITAGDIFQVVLARRWRQHTAVSPLALYRALRVINPSPYMVLLEGPEASLVGASPEMLVRVTGRRLATRPIAGTRPRDDDPVEDQRLADELLADPKERAEHVMLVDLGRNDLGRVARPGSVEVSSFMEIERYSHVMHIVSNVEAELADGRTALDALLACFPAGTVSGAPKIRAMEIIDSLESEARGPYAGAVGYLSYSGDLDTCITIRTLLVRGGEVSVTAGAGIVADSDAAAEERETESKAAALLAAVDLATALAGEGEPSA
jgi:anthranilate synthase component 1